MSEFYENHIKNLKANLLAKNNELIVKLLIYKKFDIKIIRFYIFIGFIV